MGNVPSSVPPGAQTNLVNTGFVCHERSNTDVWNTTFSLTAPLYGKNVKFNDIAGGIAIPDRLYNQGKFFDTLSTDISFGLRLIDADVDTLTVKTSSNDQSAKQQLISYSAPGTGPVAVTAGGEVTVILQYLNLTLHYVGGQFPEQINATLDVVCEGQANVVSNIVYSDDEASPSLGKPYNFPPTVPGQKAGIANIPATCTDTSIGGGKSTWALQLAGVLPNRPTGQFNIDQITTQVTVPQALVDKYAAAAGRDYSIIHFQYGKTFQGADQGLPGIQAAAIGGSGQYDWSRDFVPSQAGIFKPLEVYKNGYQHDQADLKLSLPDNGTISVGPFQASSLFRINTFGFDGYIAAYEPKQLTLVGFQNISCEVQHSSAIFGAFALP